MNTKTVTIKLRDVNDGDLECISGMQDAEGETITTEFDGNVATTLFADDDEGSVWDRIAEALDGDDNVVSYRVTV